MSTIQEGRIYCVFSLILCFGRASVQIMARSAFKLYKCLKILLEFHFNLFSVITNCISHRTKFNLTPIHEIGCATSLPVIGH